MSRRDRRLTNPMKFSRVVGVDEDFQLHHPPRLTAGRILSARASWVLISTASTTAGRVVSFLSGETGPSVLLGRRPAGL